MKPKLTAVVVVAGALLCGFWVGSYYTRKVCREIAERGEEASTRVYMVSRAEMAVRVLRNMAERKDSEARDYLEQQLDSGLAVIGHGGFTSVFRDQAFIRVARAYRSQHPWTNTHPEVVQLVRKAFEMAD